MKDDKRKKREMSDEDWRKYILKWMDIFDLMVILTICIVLGVLQFFLRLVCDN